MSGNGEVILSFFVFPRQRINDLLNNNAPVKRVGVVQLKSGINSDFFLQWLHLLVKHSHPTKQHPVLLLLNGHCSHETLPVINFCRQHNINLISSLSHTAHKLQLLDRSFIKAFKMAYNQ